MGVSASRIQPLADAPPLPESDDLPGFEVERTIEPREQGPLKPKPVRKVLYKLPFTFTICSAAEEDDAHPTDEELVTAYEICAMPEIWHPYLHFSMEDAWLKYVNDGIDAEAEGATITREPAPFNTKCVEISLSRTANRGVYEGFVYWKSCAVPLEHLQEELEWRIGDRMSCYEIQDPDGKWSSCIEIDEVTCQ